MCQDHLRSNFGHFRDRSRRQDHLRSWDHLRCHTGSDCIKALCEYFISEAHCIYKSFPEKPMDPLSVKQQIEYMKSTRCHICFKNFKQDNPKVRDHCHYTGKYRGPAHNNRNLRYRVPSYIPVIAHNSARYDTHLFIKELAKHFVTLE